MSLHTLAGQLLIARLCLLTVSDQSFKLHTSQQVLNAALPAGLAVQLAGDHYAISQSGGRYNRRLHALGVVYEDAGYLPRTRNKYGVSAAGKLLFAEGVRNLQLEVLCGLGDPQASACGQTGGLSTPGPLTGRGRHTPGCFGASS